MNIENACNHAIDDFSNELFTSSRIMRMNSIVYLETFSSFRTSTNISQSSNVYSMGCVFS